MSTTETGEAAMRLLTAAIVVAALAVVGLAFAPRAYAADLGGLGTSSLKDGPVDSAPFNWTGVYLGAGAGGTLTIAPDALAMDRSSAFGQVGAVASYQFPRSSLVVSGYGDASYSNVFQRTSYGLGGQLGAAWGSAQPFAAAGVEFMDSRTGISYGGGVKLAITQKWGLNTEWRRIEWDALSRDGVKFDATEDRVMAGVTYKLF